MAILGEFSRVRNWPFFSKNPGFENGGFRSGLEIAPNSLKRPYMLANGFLVAFGIVCGDFG